MRDIGDAGRSREIMTLVRSRDFLALHTPLVRTNIHPIEQLDQFIQNNENNGDQISNQRPIEGIP